MARTLLFPVAMKRTTKKLQLAAQTIRQLDSSALRGAAGGTLYNYELNYYNFGAIRPTVTQVQTGCPSDTMDCPTIGC